MTLESGKWTLVESDRNKRVRLIVRCKNSEIEGLNHEIDTLFYAAVSQEGPSLN